MTDDPDSALTYALWHAETSGLEVKTPMDNFADIYALFAQQVREGLRAKGFDVARLSLSAQSPSACEGERLPDNGEAK